MNFQPVEQRVTIRQMIQKALREAILNGELEPGSKLVESRLASQFGTSRAPVREAISALVEEGFVNSVPFDGYFVQQFHVKDLTDLYEMRRGLECLAFTLIWPKRTEAFFQELDLRNDRLTQAIISENKAEAIKTELALHSTVYEFTGNNLLLSAWNTLSGRLQMYWAIHQKIHNRKGAKLNGHEHYIELAKGDKLDKMLHEIVKHITLGMDSVTTQLVE